MPSTVWTTRRKWMGNLIPGAIWFIPTAAGVTWCVSTDRYTGPGLWLVVAGLVYGWIALSRFGLFENSKMRAEFLAACKARGIKPKGESFFVGYASPRHSSMLDAHQDVGLLVLDPGILSYVGEVENLEIRRDTVVRVRFRANVHSLVGLGRWIAVEYLDGEERKALLVEPRDKVSLLANRRHGKYVIAKIRAWKNG